MAWGRHTVPIRSGFGFRPQAIPFRELAAAVAVIPVFLLAWGCALSREGRLPKADVPTAPAAGPKPSLSFRISFFPPASGKERTLVEEFAQEVESSRFFGPVAPAPSDGDIGLTIVLTQACAMSSKTFVLYLATGTLVPVHVPCEYDLQAEIRDRSGKTVQYEIRDDASKLVWAPGWPPGVDWGIDPSSSALRRNLYRTLMVKMHADGLLGQRAGPPRE